MELLGIKTSIIKYVEATSSWKIEEVSFNTTAMSAASYSSFALGSQTWTISNDNKTCSTRGESYSKLLKLTGCMKGEFTCNNGQCIKMEERCDQIMDCNDESDEENCRLIVFKNNYNNKVPPFTINKDKSKTRTRDPVKVNVSTSLMNVLAISERDHTIDLKLGITLKWYDNRVLYNNLKTEEALNILSDEEVYTYDWKDLMEMPF